MEVFETMKKFMASKTAPLMKLITNREQQVWMPRGSKGTARKSVLPNKLSAIQLRNLSREPIIRKAITIVQDTLVRQPYVVDVIGGRGKYTKSVATVTNIIEHPNIIDNKETFFKRLIDDALVLDAMVVEVSRSKSPTHPIYLYAVDGSTVKKLAPIDYTNENAYRYVQEQNDGSKYFTAKQVAYLQKSYFTYNSYGFSPVQQSYNYVQYYLDAIEQASGRASNSTADFIISLGENVTEEERASFCEYMANEIEGKHGRIPVAAGTKDLKTEQLKALGNDGLYIDWQLRLTQIVAMSFGLPPERIGIVIPNDRFTHNDQEATMIQELIRPYGSMIETLINCYVIEPMGLGGILKFRFIYEDSEAQKGKKSTRLQGEYAKGLITENEFREEMGYEPSNSKYADVTYPEKTIMLNVDNGIGNGGGFNGIGNLKDTSDSKPMIDLTRNEEPQTRERH